jgi:hypothetical protein
MFLGCNLLPLEFCGIRFVTRLVLMGWSQCKQNHIMLTNGHRLSTNKLVDGLETRLCDVAHSKRQDTAHLIFTSVPLLNSVRSGVRIRPGSIAARCRCSYSCLCRCSPARLESTSGGPVAGVLGCHAATLTGLISLTSVPLPGLYGLKVLWGGHCQLPGLDHCR